jgi:hypothetical protein
VAAEHVPSSAHAWGPGTVFERRVLALAPGDHLTYDGAQWVGALVVIAQGQIELEGLDGHRYQFGRGAILWLERLPLRALHNCERTPAILVAIARRAAHARR